ncbi:class III lanthionine synthetase LanKC [Amycolatopsis oliviviridis]|uniref:non-specific serine/threonine protein kinase n=1 Tax=Amycolatopsis oliviviridis TaxID=1471590 RepID=A0ABQ3L7N2_9PSEU|nr:class III lanthionine synthetase LanKC [Amycolatopsis oliviviridis]GHH05665.1 serine/threonine protein kinase [Amycolatopsis oliviviridis]
MTSLERYALASVANPMFYDDPSRTEDELYTVSTVPPPEGWRRAEEGLWVSFAPGTKIPRQGWKIHVTARLDEAEKTIEDVLAYCLRHGVALKFLRSEFAVRLTNGKYAPRASSGKVLTLYPADDTVTERILDDLATLLADREGPYVLSDLRWGDSPVFVRYGGFVGTFTLDNDGVPVPSIEAPDGTPEPDLRLPVFAPPPWATVPEFLAKRMAALDEQASGELPYEITEALHFSNGGGVYKGTRRGDGLAVVVKEARPHAGLDALGRDAVTRLTHEHELLTELADTGFVPRVHEYFTLWEHHFLAMELVEGPTLYQELTRRNPLLRAGGDDDDRAAFVRWALPVLDELAGILATLHARGFAFGDVHPQNVLIRPDGRLCLIDFEAASTVESGSRAAMAAPGFRPPAGLAPVAADEYAFACVALFGFLPLTAMAELDPGCFEDLLHHARREFPLPNGLVARIASALRFPESVPLVTPAETTMDGRSWESVCRSIGSAITASATLDRDDRLYPGDAMQLPGAGLGLAHGAAGVLYALHLTGQPVPDEQVGWLAEHALTGHHQGPGLLNGRLGVAWALYRLGARDTALDLLSRKPDRPLTVCHLAGGLAGLVLGKLDFAEWTGDSEQTESALRDGLRLRDALDSPFAPQIPGLLRGFSGISLAFTRLYEATGDASWLDAAAAALQEDLARCEPDAQGALHVNDGSRLLPYLADGSAGVALAVEALLEHRTDAMLALARDGLLAGCRVPPWNVHAGLFTGRAGLITVAGTADDLPTLLRHAVPAPGGTGVAGDQLLRLSMDLATGAAGVLSAVHTVRHGGSVFPGLPGRRREKPAAAGAAPVR